MWNDYNDGYWREGPIGVLEMIKIIGSLCCAASLMIATPAFAAKQDYKCYINSSKKGHQVVFYRWDSKDIRLKVASLPGKQLSDNKGKTYFIKEVEECVLLSQKFTSKKAKTKDKQTLR